MIVDCNECAAKGPACSDCVVTVLLGEPTFGPPGERTGASERSVITIEQEERDAIDVLAEIGLVPRLRLVRAVDGPADPDSQAVASCDPRRTG